MKAVLFLLVSAMAFSASAFGLESHYGRVKNRGFNYHCTFRNNTSRTLDMKYVVFQVEQAFGDSLGQELQIRIDRKVAPGAVIDEETDVAGSYTVPYCKYLAR